MPHSMSKRERWCELLAFVLLHSRWKGTWGDKICILCNRSNTSAEKLLLLTGTQTRSFKLCHIHDLCHWGVTCLLHSSHVTDVTKKRKRRNKNLTAEWSRHREKYAFTGAIIQGDRNTQAFLKSWKENSWPFAGSIYIGNNSRSKKTFYRRSAVVK